MAFFRDASVVSSGNDRLTEDQALDLNGPSIPVTIAASEEAEAPHTFSAREVNHAHTERIRTSMLLFQEQHIRTFPVEPFGKDPHKELGKLSSGDGGYKHGTLDLDKIEKWLELWPNMNFGWVNEDVCAVDIDRNASKKKIGSISWQAYARERQEEFENAPMVQTGGGGLQILLRNPGRLERGKDVFGKHVDFLGLGGYAVGLGSRYHDMESCPDGARCKNSPPCSDMSKCKHKVSLCKNKTLCKATRLYVWVKGKSLEEFDEIPILPQPLHDHVVEFHRTKNLKDKSSTTSLSKDVPNIHRETGYTFPKKLQGLTSVEDRGKGSWKAICPAHDDHNPSLSIKESHDRYLLHCHTGCSTEDVCKALGISIRDLFLPPLKRLNGKIAKELSPKIEKTFTRVDTASMITAAPQYVAFSILRQSLTIIEGIGGIGKSTLLYSISAGLTRGDEFSDGSKNEPMNVAVISVEDILDIVVEKLRVYNVDHERLHLLPSMNDGSGKPRRFLINEDADLLRDYIIKNKIDLLYIDAFVSHVGRGIDLWKGQAARDLMTVLQEIAIETGCAIVVTRHWKKGTGAASERGANSNEIRNVARSSMVVGLHPDNSDIHVLAPEKGNYKKGGGKSYGFRIEPHKVTFGDGEEFDLGRVVPIGPVDVTADDLALAEARTSKERSALSEARQAILQALLEGPVLTLDLLKRLKSSGHAEKTVEQARHALSQEKLISREGGWKGVPLAWLLTKRGIAAAEKGPAVISSPRSSPLLEVSDQCEQCEQSEECDQCEQSLAHNTGTLSAQVAQVAQVAQIAQIAGVIPRARESAICSEIAGSEGLVALHPREREGRGGNNEEDEAAPAPTLFFSDEARPKSEHCDCPGDSARTRDPEHFRTCQGTCCYCLPCKRYRQDRIAA